MQIDNLAELPSEKRPTEDMIWEGSPEELERWIERVIKGKEKKDLDFIIKDEDID